jgi:DNA repair exonuclease SbcCD ATPase subunit
MNSSKIYKTIYHLSDIHIRLYARKIEYEYVFEQLYAFLKNENNNQGLIVITGDILHNKIDLTPECILLTLQFLKRLCQIMDVVIIAGNHDALLNNKERIDSLTSILKDRSPSNLYYFKYTGYYDLGNIKFGLNSILDDKSLTVIQHPPNQIFIGLFHGQMTGWKNCFGFQTNHGETSADDWKNFDLVLLGDIHKFQYMNEEQTIAYAGSLISQNFGETDKEHGVLIWNLDTKSSHYHILENPYAYKWMEIIDDLSVSVDNTIYQWDKIESIIPRFGNIKLKLHSDEYINKNVILGLKKKYPNVKFQFEYFSKEMNLNQLSSTTILNINQNESLWIQNYVLSQLNNKISKPLIEKIITHLYNQYKKHLQNSRTNHPSWELISVTFSNLFGYGKENEIDFQQLNKHTMTGIFGKNSVGKSSLIDIISFLLYGKITRGSNGNSIPKEIINIQESSSYGEIQFSVGNQIYKMEKKMTRKQDKIKIVEQLFILESNNWKNITEEHRKKTDKLIEQLLGSYESFLFTNMTLQQNMKSFRDMTQKEKKEFLYQLLSLNAFEDIKKQSEDELKHLKIKEKLLLDSIKNNKSILLQSLSELCHKKESSQKRIDIYISNLNQLESEYNQYLLQHIDIDNYKSIEQEVDFLNKNLQEIQYQQSQCIQEQKQIHLYLQQHSKTHISNLLNQFQTIYEIKDQLLSLQDADISIIINKSYNDWISFYQHIKNILSRSEDILNQYQEYTLKKHKLENQLQTYNIQSSDYMSLEKFKYFESKQCKYQQEIKDLELKLESIQYKEIESCQSQCLSSLLSILSNYKTNNCQLQLYQHSFKDALHIEYNKKCQQCMTHPFYLKKQEYIETIKSVEFQIKKEEAKIKKLLQEQNQLKEYLTYEENIREFQLEIETQQTLKLEFLKLKELLFQKKETFQQNLQKYENTKIYQEYKTLLQMYESLPQTKIIEEYQLLNSHLKKISFYEKIDHYFDLLKPFQNEFKNVDELQIILDRISSKENRLEKIQSELDTYSHKILEIKYKLKEQETYLNKYRDNIIIQQKMNQDKEQIDNIKDKIKVEQSLYYESEKKIELLQYEIQQLEQIELELKQIQDEKLYLESLICCIDREGLPLYMLKMILPKLEDDMNQLLSSFLSDKKIQFKVIEKDVIIGMETSQMISNYLGGMESFITDLSLKFIFSKYAQIPKSNFFIIDEGVSVFDQEKISNIHILFNFLTSIVDHVFLISHLPSIQDFVDQNISIQKENGYSRLICNY